MVRGLYLTICQFHNYLEVEFLPVHNPSPEEIDSPGGGGEGGRGVYSDHLLLTWYCVEGLDKCLSCVL